MIVKKSLNLFKSLLNNFKKVSIKILKTSFNGVKNTVFLLTGKLLKRMCACDTGRIDEEATDGTVILPRSFYIAGARNVIMTLWELIKT